MFAKCLGIDDEGLYRHGHCPLFAPATGEDLVDDEDRHAEHEQARDDATREGMPVPPGTHAGHPDVARDQSQEHPRRCPRSGSAYARAPSGPRGFAGPTGAVPEPGDHRWPVSHTEC